MEQIVQKQNIVRFPLSTTVYTIALPYAPKVRARNHPPGVAQGARQELGHLVRRIASQ
ncbi:hypothetical protein PMI14_04919 [Acidovorax sp. CF316]|nr:hypothetical protein PMI14_04919 [Acidovorax sp. CF316]